MEDQEKNEPQNELEKALNHYYKVTRNIELSYSKKAALIPAKYQEGLEYIWEEHELLRREYSQYADPFFSNEKQKPKFSYLDLKIALAHKLFENCIFCERKCHVNRNQEQGFCKVQQSKIASQFLHMGEERPLIPSHTIFYTGCTFKCVYCQNWDISQHPNDGMIIPEQKMAEIIDNRRSAGSANVNFVGGDPNPHILHIIRTIAFIKKNIPVIWNSNFYMSQEAMSLLDGMVDLYLSDFKYGNDSCAIRLSNVPDYWEITTRNHKLAWKCGDMIIRHLVLPNHVECCTKPILDWIYDNLGKTAVLNIMAQYRPVYKAYDYDDISRFLLNQEFKEAVEYAYDLGFINLI